MDAWKLIVYLFGLALGGMFLALLVGIAIFGPDANDWFDWQNRLVSGFGGFFGLIGFIVGVGCAVKATTRLIP